MTLLGSATEKFNVWLNETIAYPPHLWLDDPRDPLFTFMWGDREFGFYAMSVTFWSEILIVRLYFVLIRATSSPEIFLQHRLIFFCSFFWT